MELSTSGHTPCDSAFGRHEGVGASVSEGHLGEQVGRYTLLRKAGEGGMGVVYVAYDAELDRRVAVKLLRPELSVNPRVRDQLLSEAQMLAKLSHPNVLHVYDVGVYLQKIYLALEYVEGETLRAWQESRRGDWRALVRMYRECGEGLVAAHLAGLTHRDFKPDNVLVGKDGRPRVLDFGLATESSEDAGPGEHDRSAEGKEPGRRVGTPAYMSPEQHAGREANARSDQFSFCVALYEALHGSRPFKGDSIQELGHSVLRGAPAPPRDGTPAWLRRLVTRGLAVEPAARWPSMRALLAEIDRRMQSKAMLWTLYTTLVALGTGAVLALRPGDEICRGADGLLGVWDAERRAAAHQAVMATGVPFAAATWARVAVALDVQAEGWVERHNGGCAAVRIRGERSLAWLERRTACLDDRLRELDAFVRVLLEARPETVAMAVSAAAELLPVSLCDDDDRLLTGVVRPESPALAAEVEVVRRKLARVRGLEQAGDFKAAMREAEDAQRAALSLADPPLHAEAALARGRTALGLSRFSEAAEQLEAAFHGARRSRHDDVTLEAALHLIRAQGGLTRYEAADVWARLAEDELLRGDDSPGPRVAWLLSRGELALERGEPREALALAQEALALQGPERQTHPDTPRILELLGQALLVLDRLDEALEAYDRGLALATAIFGEQHPSIVPLLNARAQALAGRARYDEAIAVARRGLAIQAAVFGTTHPHYATSLARLGEMLVLQGQPDAALEYLEEAVEIRVRALGPNDPAVAKALLLVGKMELHLGHLERSVTATRRALAVLTRAFGPAHLLVATAKQNLGVLLGKQGDRDGSLAMLMEAQQHLEKVFPLNHERVLMVRGNLALNLRRAQRYDEAISEYNGMLASLESPGVSQSWLLDTLMQLADTYTERGAPAEAVAPLERALVLATEESLDVERRDANRALVRAATGEDPGSRRARIELALAEALWTSGADRPRARQLAESGAAALRGAGPDAAEQLRTVEAWLLKRARERARL